MCVGGLCTALKPANQGSVCKREGQTHYSTADCFLPGWQYFYYDNARLYMRAKVFHTFMAAGQGPFR